MAELDGEKLRDFLASARKDVTHLLCDLIAIPSVRGGERAVNHYLQQKFLEICDESTLVPVPETIVKDPDYAFPLEGITYADRPNTKAVLRGSGRGRKLILNTHTDVVPPSMNQDRPFEPRQEGGVIFGRGACDAKGQAAVVYLACLAVRELKLPRAGDVEVHLVIEEESGGNGTLAMIRAKPTADACVVLEPSDLKICPSVRGAVWFELTVHGRPGHSGTPGSSVSALKKAIDAMHVLEGYHDRLLQSSRGVNPLFDAFDNPMPVTFGEMNCGDWPAMSPTRAVLRGVFGFLPPTTRREVQKEMEGALRTEGDEWLRENFELRFPMLNSDGNVLDPGHPFVRAMEAAESAAGVEPVLSALTGSCDAWLYANQLGIPTVVFGAGSLDRAHSNEEQIALADIERAAEILVHLICDWCNRD